MITTTLGDLVTEFKCTSSVIFLTHPTIIKELIKSSFFSKPLNISIREIYHKNEDGSMEKIWPSDGQNLINSDTKAMKTLHVVLNSPQQISTIQTFAKKYPFSISDIDGVLKNKEISKSDNVNKLVNVLPLLSEDSVKTAEIGEKFQIPDNLIKYIKMIPDTEGMKKPKVPIFGKKFTLYKEDGLNIAELD